MKLTHEHANGVKETYTVESASYANQQEDSVVVITEERGAVVLDSRSPATAKMYTQLMASGVAITPYQPAPQE